jgi:hypothetical protein
MEQLIMNKSTSTTSKSAGKSAQAVKAKGPTKAQLEKAAKLFGTPTLEAPKDTHEVTDEQRKGERRQAESNHVMQFAAQQLSTPHVEPLKAPQTMLPPPEFLAEVAALAKKYNVATPAVTVKAPRANRIMQNNVTRPSPDSLCGKIWAAADKLSSEPGHFATIAVLKELPEIKGINDHTVKTQYARWRSFNGVKGRLPKIVAGDHHGSHNSATPETKS